MRTPKQVPPVLRIYAPVKNMTGLGDAIKMVTGAIGIKACQGCEQRASLLNRWVGLIPFGGSDGPR